MSSAAERESIVDTALMLAGHRGWDALRLHQVANERGVGLEGIHRHFREKEELVDAWFDRADRAMLHRSAQPGFAVLSRRDRIRCLLMAWLEALRDHRTVTRQMIVGKLEPGHLHYQMGGLTRISRTVQWLREGAGFEAAFPRRAVEEAALTGIYLAAFTRWLVDDSAGATCTAELLDRLLTRAACLLGLEKP